VSIVDCRIVIVAVNFVVIVVVASKTPVLVRRAADLVGYRVVFFFIFFVTVVGVGRGVVVVVAAISYHRQMTPMTPKIR
jgi:hypothetical protein